MPVASPRQGAIVQSTARGASSDLYRVGVASAPSTLDTPVMQDELSASMRIDTMINSSVGVAFTFGTGTLTVTAYYLSTVSEFSAQTSGSESTPVHTVTLHSASSTC